MAHKAIKAPSSAYRFEERDARFEEKDASHNQAIFGMHHRLWKEITSRILGEEPLRDTLNFICQQAVSGLGFSGAAIGIKEQDGTLLIHSTAGIVDIPKQKISLRWDDGPQGQNPVGRAIRTGEPQVLAIAENLYYMLFRYYGAKIEHATVVVLPIIGKTGTAGVLAVSLSAGEAPDIKQMNLLEHLAMNIALAMTSAQNKRLGEHTRFVSERSRDVFILINEQGLIIEANKSATKVYGYTREELLAMRFKDLFADEGLEPSGGKLESVLHKGLQCEAVHKDKYGRNFAVEIIAQSDLVGASPVILTIIRDISRRKVAEEGLWNEKERAQVTLRSIADGVITTDADGRIEMLNSMAEQLTGWTTQLAKGVPLPEVFNIVDEMTGRTLGNPVLECVQSGRVLKLDQRIMLVGRNGQRYLIEASIAPISGSIGQNIGTVLVFRNVTEKRKLVRRLFHQARHDQLTGLPNRVLFNEYLNQTLQKAAVSQVLVGLLFLDIDRFKTVNDTMGHAWGDVLLQAIADRIKNCLRSGDMVARQGGDEFLILLPDLGNSQTAAEVAERVLQALAEPFVLDLQDVYVSASIGIAIYPLDGQNPEELLKHGDAAMYYAKSQGRNNFQFFTGKANAAIEGRLALENRLRKAIVSRELVVYYQPQVELRSGRIAGLEALVRWNTSDWGIISPAQFIPIAEETGLIFQIDKLVLQTACAQVSEWRKAGYNVHRLTVNLSARQFRYPKLVELIMYILEQAKLEPACLELEITESVAIEDVEFTVETLQALRKQGIHVSLDDFGMGFSSLAHLRYFPLDTLKIDQSFTRDIGKNRSGTEIAGAIISLAKILDLRVVAEGVETREQLEFLKARECHEIQGYLFSKAVPAAEIERMLIENKCLAV